MEEKDKMTNTQRMKSDIATMDRREMADDTVRNSRFRNDELTRERRNKVDKAIDDHRIKNDETTFIRREIKDENQSAVLAVSLLILVVLGVGIFSIFI